MTANEAKERLIQVLRDIERLAGALAKTEIELSERVLRAAFDDIAVHAGRAANEAEPNP